MPGPPWHIIEYIYTDKISLKADKEVWGGAVTHFQTHMHIYTHGPALVCPLLYDLQMILSDFRQVMRQKLAKAFANVGNPTKTMGKPIN